MARINTDPFQEIERIMNNTYRAATPTTMAMDLYRKDDTFVAMIDLPGVDPETIDIDIDDRTLTVRAKRQAVEGEDIKWLSHERTTGTFARQLTLGYGMALDRITADYSDGVLTLTMPVSEESKPRKVTVNTHSSDRVIDA